MKNLIISACLFSAVLIAGDEGMYVKGYPLSAKKYEDIKEMLNKVKSEKGSISYVKFSSKLLVHDLPDVHRTVQKILQESATPAVNIRVDIDFVNEQMIKNWGIKLSYLYDDGSKGRLKGSYDGKDLKKPRGITIDPKNQKTTKSRNTSMFIMTASGSPGQLWTTKSVIDRRQLRFYDLVPFQLIQDGDQVTIVNGNFPQPVVREVGSSMWVLPTYMPNGLVHIEIFPVVTYEMRDGSEQSFRVDKVKTTVTVAPGRRMYVGGGNKAMRKYLKDVFATEVSSEEFKANLSIYVTPHVQILNPDKDEKSNLPATERPGRDTMWQHFPD